MDHLAQTNTGRPGPWPDFEGIDIAAMARALGCPAMRIETHDELIAQLDEVIPTLGRRDQPLLLEMAIAP
jgi:benzoylformate decarboxylase